MKRAWMLLLAVIALVALMTIPAMAADLDAVEPQVFDSTAVVGTKVFEKTEATEAEWSAYSALIGTKLTCTADSGLQLTFEADGIYLRSADEVWHCICGANSNETHIGDCDGFDVSWTKYEMTNENQLPNVNGRYYLVDADSDPSDKQVVIPHIRHIFAILINCRPY